MATPSRLKIAGTGTELAVSLWSQSHERCADVCTNEQTPSIIPSRIVSEWLRQKEQGIWRHPNCDGDAPPEVGWSNDQTAPGAVCRTGLW